MDDRSGRWQGAAVACVVLAGGEGRRMGGAKLLQPLGGARLIDRAVALARAFGTEVAVVVRDPGQLPDAPDAAVLVDPPEIPGPLAGVAAALRWGRDRGAGHVLTLACDMPRLPSDLLARLWGGLQDAPAAGAAMALCAGRLHPTCTLWSVAALEQLPSYLAGGRSSLHGFAEAAGMVAVDWPDDQEIAFVNVNTPEDLAALERGEASADSATPGPPPPPAPAGAR